MPSGSEPVDRSSTVESDVVVVGGGIAGATTARFLAEAGHRVVVLEKARFPRDKPCGEGVMPTGVRWLHRLGVLETIPAHERHPIRGVRFVISGRDEVRGEFPDVGDGFRTGMGIRRLVLDQRVLEHARAHPNVEIHEGEGVIDVSRPDGRWAEVRTATRCYRARVLVGADGIRSLVRRKLELELPRTGWQRYGMRAHFQFPEGTRLEDFVSVYRDSDGECYTTPVGDHVLEIALLIGKRSMKQFAGGLGEGFHQYLTGKPHLRGLIAGGQQISEVVACGPFDVWARCRVADRAVLVGDAGGYLDPITGEGISLALEGAHMAAEVIDEALRRDDLTRARLMPYHRRLNRAIRHYKLLTRALLAVARYDRLSGFVVRRLAHCPELYTRLLGINCGVLTFWDLRPRDLLGLLRA